MIVYRTLKLRGDQTIKVGDKRAIEVRGKYVVATVRSILSVEKSGRKVEVYVEFVY